MNAIALLETQHKKTKAALDKASKGKLDRAESKAALDELIGHMVIEEFVFYPRIRELMKDLVGESYEEHTVARFAIARALEAKTDDEIKARFTVLKELIEHHVKEEEDEMFPKVKRSVDFAELERLGATMEQMFLQAKDLGFAGLVHGLEQTLHPVAPVAGPSGKATLRSPTARL